MSRVKISVLIPECNAILCIGRSVSNALRFADRICVLDYGSTDGTRAEVLRFGAELYDVKASNSYEALIWAKHNLELLDGWIVVMRPEDYLLDRTIEQLRDYLQEQPHYVTGCTLIQRYHFMHRWMKHARMYPLTHLKAIRAGHFHLVKPWLVDYRVRTDEKIVNLPLEYVHDNPASLTEWIERKNIYTDHLAVEVIYHELELYKLRDPIPQEMQIPHHNIYYGFPLYAKTLASFFCHYFVLGGFLDGKEGLIFTFFRCFWHRALAYGKVAWIYRMNLRNVPRIVAYVQEHYNFDLTR